jgi:hypothetical protein
MTTQLWGQSYIDLYAGYVVPSLLQEDNLPALAVFGPSTYEIYTTAADRDRLEAHPNFQELRATCADWLTVRCVILDNAETFDSPYALMSDCHRRAIAAAEAVDAAILFLQPDVVVSPGSLATVALALKSGKRLVLAPGLRAAREEMTAMMRRHLDRPAGPGWPSRRTLVGAAVSNLHPISRFLFWRDGTINSYCSHLYWAIGPKGIYARCAHMHPLMVWPREKGCGFNHTIDWDYFSRACPNSAEWFVAATSDEICLIELSDREKFAGSETLRRSTSRTLANFLAFGSEQAHRELLGGYHLFLGADVMPKDWAAAHTEAEAVVGKALRLYQRRRRFGFLFAPKLMVLTIVKILQNTKATLSRFSQDHPLIGPVVYRPFLAVYLVFRAIWRARLWWPTLPPVEPGLERRTLWCVAALDRWEERLHSFKNHGGWLGGPLHRAFGACYRSLRFANRAWLRAYGKIKSLPRWLLDRI